MGEHQHVVDVFGLMSDERWEADRAHGTKPSVLIRDWIEMHLSAADEDRQISLADALRALASLRTSGNHAA